MNSPKDPEHKPLLVMALIAITAIIVLFSTARCEELPELNPDMEIWQPIKKGQIGKVICWPRLGGMRQVRERSPKTMAEFDHEMKQRDKTHAQEIRETEREVKTKAHQQEHRFGGFMKIGGWCVLVLGAVAYAICKSNGIHLGAHWAFALGIGMILGGIGIQKMVEIDQRWGFLIEIGVLVLLAVPVGVYLYKTKDWSAKEAIQKRKQDKRDRLELPL
jgi:hypothetical protein